MKNIRLLLALPALLFAGNIFAGDFINGKNVTINTPQHEDLYISAGNVVINAPVFGDVIIAGGNVTINDSVMNDVIVVGGTVILHGYVGDDVRCAGGEITITRHIAGDLIAAGGNINFGRNASAEDLIVTGGEVYFDGTVRKSLRVIAGTTVMNGAVSGNADVRGGKITVNGVIQGKASFAASKDIIINSSAKIGRSIRYWLPLEKPLIVPEGVSSYQPVYDPLLSITYSRWYFLGASTLLGLLWYLGMAFVMTVILQYLFSRTFSKAGNKVVTKPVVSALWGFVFFIGVPVISVILLVTIIGVPVAMILMLLYVFSLLLATVITSLVISNWVKSVSGNNWSLWKTSAIAMFTFILLKIISFTPFFGWAVVTIMAATAFGALLTSARWRRTALNPHEEPTVRSIAV